MAMDDRSMFYGASAEMFAKAKALRESTTEAEKLLWKKISGNQLLGYRFKRQHPIASYIVDFYCHKAKLVIELDGGYHENLEQESYDNQRTTDLEDLGLIVLRFANEKVQTQIELVLERICDYLQPHTL